MPFKRTARKVAKKVINTTSNALSAPARMKSARKVRRANAETNVLKNDIDNRRPGNWTGSPQQMRTRNMAIYIRGMRNKKK